MWLDREPTHALSSQPPLFQSSAPGQSSCASNNCHGGEINTGGGNIEILASFDENENVYSDGSLLDISVSINDPDATRFGFQMVALDAVGNSVGSFVTNDDPSLAIQFGMDIEFINHNMVPFDNPNTFNFQYQAPDGDVGPITFYATGMAADGLGSPADDDRYSNGVEITWTEPSGIESDLFASTNIFPNPISGGQLQITGLPFEKAEVNIYDLQGKLHQSKRCYQDDQIDVAALRAGIYMVNIGNDKYQISRKLVVR